jgi:tetratricopeptide (TPR) repeat protein
MTKDKKSWVEKISDEEDLWLRATRLEEEGNYEEASHLYIEEGKCREAEGDLAKAALCYLSAAKCKIQSGEREEALGLYGKAASNYESYAKRILGLSPQSASWGYRVASKCYLSANEYGKAEECLRIANSIMEKVEAPTKSLLEAGVDEEKPVFKPFKGKGGRRVE